VIEKPKDGVHALGAFLVTTRPYPGAHESHQQKLNSTYKKPASTRVPNSGSASRAIVGYHHGTPCHDYAGPSPMTSPSNPASVPEAPYEYLIHLPLSVRPRPATRQHASGLLSESCTLGTTGRRLWPNYLGTTQFCKNKLLRNHGPPVKGPPSEHSLCRRNNSSR
jgi:hypothetical protein